MRAKEVLQKLFDEFATGARVQWPYEFGVVATCALFQGNRDVILGLVKGRDERAPDTLAVWLGRSIEPKEPLIKILAGLFPDEYSRFDRGGDWLLNDDVRVQTNWDDVSGRFLKEEGAAEVFALLSRAVALARECEPFSKRVNDESRLK